MTRTPSVMPGHTNAKMPNAIAATPRNAITHQCRVSSSIANMFVPPRTNVRTVDSQLFTTRRCSRQQPPSARCLLLCLHEAIDKLKRGVGDFAPATIDHERVAAVRDFGNLRHARVVLLLFVTGLSDRPWDSVVLFTGDDQERTTLRIFAVYLDFGPGIQVGGCGLEQGDARGRNRELRVQLLGFGVAHRIGKAVSKLLIRQRDRALVVQWVTEHWPCRLE